MRFKRTMRPVALEKNGVPAKAIQYAGKPR